MHFSCSTSTSREPFCTMQLVLEVKEKLEKYHSNLPLGRYGRDDEDMILCFLDCKFSVKDTVSKLSNAMIWRRKFGVEELCEESVKTALKIGKSYLHDFLEVHERQALIVEVAKHIPVAVCLASVCACILMEEVKLRRVHERSEDEKLSVFLIEKALSKIPKVRR